MKALLRCMPLLLVLGLVSGGRDRALGDDNTIVGDLREFLENENPQQRAALAAKILADPAFGREGLTDWLHRAKRFPAWKQGKRRIRVDTGAGVMLDVVLRIPHEYDPRRPYPTIYALHGMGGTGDGIIAYVERLLGGDVERFVIVAPTHYVQDVLHAGVSLHDEHRRVLRAAKETAHVDSRRVYALGFSRGGHAAWTLAITHPCEFAGVIPIGGTLIVPQPETLYPTLLPNLASTRVLASWGQKDVMAADGVTPGEDGGIAGMNRRLCSLAASMTLPVRWFEVPDKGHEYIEPPREDLAEILSAEREAYPDKFGHLFRYVYQGQTAWVEAHAWRGPWWDDKPIELRFLANERPSDPAAQKQAFLRAVRGRLGELRGEIDGQKIDVYRKKISELTVWIGDGMIDWDRPILLEMNGRKAFEGRIEPDLLVCLTQAARTLDFDRLRWAGLRFKSGSRTKIVTADTPFPDAPLMPE